MSGLSQIKIGGFKSIRELDLKLGNLNVLIGANGAGKSNFILAFELLNQIVESRLQVFSRRLGGADALLYYGKKVSQEISIWLSFGSNGYALRLSPDINDDFYFSKEVCWYVYPTSGVEFDVRLGEGHQETNLRNEAKKPNAKIARYVLSSLVSWKVYHFHDTSETAKIKGTGDVNDNVILRPDASNLAAFLYLLKDTRPDHYQRIVKTIQLVAPFFEDFILRPNPHKRSTIRLEWQEKNSDSYFNAGSLSDGTLRFMCLSTLLLQPNLPSTILIDEPELGLHPYAIVLLASMLKSAATRTQVIVSTQSVPLVNQFKPENIIVVDRDNNQSVFKQLSSAEINEWLDEYGLGDLWEKNVIGGRP